MYSGSICQWCPPLTHLLPTSQLFWHCPNMLPFLTSSLGPRTHLLQDILSLSLNYNVEIRERTATLTRSCLYCRGNQQVLTASSWCTHTTTHLRVRIWLYFWVVQAIDPVTQEKTRLFSAQHWLYPPGIQATEGLFYFRKFEHG